MKYDVVSEKKGVKSFTKLDKGQQNMIAAWIEKNLVQTDSPRKHGKALKGEWKDYWRYRVGNYQLLADINDEEIKFINIHIGIEERFIDNKKNLVFQVLFSIYEK